MRISFGPFAFDRQSRLLWRDGAEVALPPRVLGVLEVLIDRPGQVVARQDLLDGVWKDAFVTDTSLAEAVSFLRQALGDDPQSPRYIQTVHRRGYRFMAPIEAGTAAPPPSAAPAETRPSIVWELLPGSVAIVLAGLAAAAAWGVVGHREPSVPPVVRFELHLPSDTSLNTDAPSLAVSADSRLIAWSGCDRTSGSCSLFLRAVDRTEPTRLAGTEGATFPAFSPDARWIAFFADGKLKKVAVSGGPSSAIADAPAPGGLDWGADGRIVFAGRPAGGLLVVDEQGGAVTELTTPRVERGEVRHLHPSWLSRGPHILFTIATRPDEHAPGDLAVASTSSRSAKVLRSGVTRAAVAGRGYLLLFSGTDLQAATFDERSLTLTGGADPAFPGADGVGDFAIGRGGSMVAIRAASRLHVWPDDGADRPALSRLSSIAVSPDSRRLAGVIHDGTTSDIWIGDSASDTLTRLTHGGASVSPAWAADGQYVVFATRTSGSYALGARRVDDRAPAPVPATPPDAHAFPSSVAGDGRIAITTTLAGGRTGVAILPAGGGAPQVLTDGPFNEASAVFSPDGEWLALESDESGVREIILRGARGGQRFAVSTGGGVRPRWSADGRWIFFEAGHKLMRAPILVGAERQGGKPELVLNSAADVRVMAVTPAGRQLVEVRAPVVSALVVLEWLRELRQRLPLPVRAPR